MSYSVFVMDCDPVSLWVAYWKRAVTCQPFEVAIRSWSETSQAAESDRDGVGADGRGRSRRGRGRRLRNGPVPTSKIRQVQARPRPPIKLREAALYQRPFPVCLPSYP